MALSITGFGGVGEIGGNAFLVEDGKRRFYLDFGKQFGNDSYQFGADGPRLIRGQRPGWGDFFDQFVGPRTHSAVTDLMKLGMLPFRPQDYRADVGGSNKPTDLDFVVVSHAHIDHVGMIPYLKPEIPVIMSDVSKVILGSMETSGQGGLENDFTRWKPRATWLERTKKELVQRRKVEPGIERAILSPEAPRVNAGNPMGDWSIETFPLDHSIHGAMGTVLTHPEHGDIVYTGDFRMHGRMAEGSRRFVEALDRPSALIIEGTRVRHGPATNESSEEEDIQRQIEVALGEAGKTRCGFVCIGYPPKDMDRLISVYEACRRNDRILLVSTRQACMILDLRAAGVAVPDPHNDPYLQVYLPAKERAVALREPGRPIPYLTQHYGWRELDLSDEPTDAKESKWREYMEADYKSWERKLVQSLGDRFASARTVREALDKYVFSFSYWTMPELFDLFDDPAQADGIYIHSQTQPFNDDMEIKRRKLDRWLEAFHLQYRETHVSGHLSQTEIEWVLDKVDPRVVVPIHSLAPDITRDRFEARTGRKGLMLQHGAKAKLG